MLKSKRPKSSRIISAYYIPSLLFLSEGVILLATSFIYRNSYVSLYQRDIIIMLKARSNYWRTEGAVKEETRGLDREWLHLRLCKLCWHNFEPNRQTLAFQNYAGIIGRIYHSYMIA